MSSVIHKRKIEEQYNTPETSQAKSTYPHDHILSKIRDYVY